jgi:hypothetical protein
MMRPSATIDDRTIYTLDRRGRIDAAEVAKTAVAVSVAFALATMVAIAILI